MFAGRDKELSTLYASRKSDVTFVLVIEMRFCIKEKTQTKKAS